MPLNQQTSHLERLLIWALALLAFLRPIPAKVQARPVQAQRCALLFPLRYMLGVDGVPALPTHSVKKLQRLL